jgi:hypothetical protein
MKSLERFDSVVELTIDHCATWSKGTYREEKVDLKSIPCIGSASSGNISSFIPLFGFLLLVRWSLIFHFSDEYAEL